MLQEFASYFLSQLAGYPLWLAVLLLIVDFFILASCARLCLWRCARWVWQKLTARE